MAQSGAEANIDGKSRWALAHDILSEQDNDSEYSLRSDL